MSALEKLARVFRYDPDSGDEYASTYDAPKAKRGVTTNVTLSNIDVPGMLTLHKTNNGDNKSEFVQILKRGQDETFKNVPGGTTFELRHESSVLKTWKTRVDGDRVDQFVAALSNLDNALSEVTVAKLVKEEETQMKNIKNKKKKKKKKKENVRKEDGQVERWEEMIL